MNGISDRAPRAGVVSGERFLSSRALQLNARRAAAAMHDVGIWQGDVVVLLLRNDFACFEATFAAGQLGATTVPVNWHMTAEEIARVLDDCEAKLIVGHADLLAESVLAGCGGRQVISVETPPEIAAAYNIEQTRCRTPGGLGEWYNWIGAYPEWDAEPRVVSAPMFYTSGTTGMPKGVSRKSVTPEVAARAAGRTRKAFGLEDENISSIMTGPLCHSAPNAYGMKVVREGGLLVLQPRFDAQDTLGLIERYRISHLHMVPIMFSRLLELDSTVRSAYDLGSLRHVVHGAAPCPAGIKRRMIEWWGPVVHEYYAMTETGIIAMCDSEEWLAHPGTVGRAAEGIAIRTLDEEGRDTDTGVPGEICVESETTPYVAYHRAEKKTEELHRAGYLATGDVGYLDEDGFLFISDRISDMVISGGVNIYPAEIEKVLSGLDNVKDSAVFGIPDPEFGERLVAVIETAEALDSDSISEFLKGSIAGYKVPREYVFTPNLPREDSGKIRKRLLRESFRAGTLR